MNYPQPIQEIMRKVVLKAQSKVLSELQTANSFIETIHYHYSPIHEIQQDLQNMMEGVDTPSERFPLVWLNESPPIPQNRSNQDGFFGTVTLQMWIMFHTKQNYTSEEREQLVFAPILRPIYYNIIQAITTMVEFSKPDERYIDHSFYEHKFLGTNDKTANVFSEFVDAIEMRDLTLRMNYKNCFTPAI